MQYVIHKADDRGHAHHGWLDTWHSFSFASYYNPSKIRFGAIRVINDDTIAPGMGFGTHPHDNMEIITIPLEGAVKHADSTGHEEVIGVNEVQVMTAGTGIQHSEFNASKTDELKLLQIWIFPDEENLKPGYAQHLYSDDNFKNQLHTIVGGRKVDAPIKIHQNAQLSMGRLNSGQTIEYTFSDSKNGLYVFNIEGKVNIAENDLNRRDAIGIWETNRISITVIEDAHLLLLEIPK